MNKKITQQMMDDVVTVTKKQWGVECYIQESQNSPYWKITISKLHKDLIYCQTQDVAEVSLQGYAFPSYLFQIIDQMVFNLKKEIEKAEHLDKTNPLVAGTAENNPWSWEDYFDKSKPLLKSTYPQTWYSTSTTTPPVVLGSGYKSVYWNSIKEEKVPVKSLKEMYELDAAKKVKKVKKVKLTAAQKEAEKLNPQPEPTQGVVGGGGMLPPDPLYKEMVNEFFNATNPFYEHLKNKKVGTWSGSKVQENLAYPQENIPSNVQQNALHEAQMQAGIKELEQKLKALNQLTEEKGKDLDAKLKHKEESKLFWKAPKKSNDFED